MLRHLRPTALLACAVACAKPDRPPTSPSSQKSGDEVRDATETSVEAADARPLSNSAPEYPPYMADRARAFVRALVEGNADDVAAKSGFPLSFRMSGRACPDAATADQVAEWVLCVHERVGRLLRAPRDFETVEVHVSEKTELSDPPLSMLSDAREDDVFATVSLRGAPVSMGLTLVYERRPSVAVRIVHATFVRLD
jgi:hypothetical protein